MNLCTQECELFQSIRQHQLCTKDELFDADSSLIFQKNRGSALTRGVSTSYTIMWTYEEKKQILVDVCL